MNTVRTKLFWLALIVMLLAVWLTADAQQPAKVHKIGWLGTRLTSAGGQEVIRRILRDLGYVEGKNIAFEYRFADNKVDRLPALADELLRLKVDVLVTPGINEALVAKNATKTIPIVFLAGLILSWLSLLTAFRGLGKTSRGSPTLGRYWLASDWNYSRKPFPSSPALRCFGIPQNPSSAQQWKESQLAARELGLQLHSMEVSSADKYESAFKEAIKARSTALASSSSTWPILTKNKSRAWRQKTVCRRFTPREDRVANGGLMSYGPDRRRTL